MALRQKISVGQLIDDPLIEINVKIFVWETGYANGRESYEPSSRYLWAEKHWEQCKRLSQSDWKNFVMAI